MVLFFHLLLMLIALTGSFPYGPTDEEINRAVRFQSPSESWGFVARKTRDLRIAVVGGSNSANTGYVEYLADFYRNSTNKRDYSVSVLNHAISGCIVNSFIGLRYDFEDNPPNTWPNVIMLEFSVNYLSESKIAEETNAVIQNIRFRYKQQNLPDPDFVFIELFSFQLPLSGMNERTSQADKLTSLSFSKREPMRIAGYFRGCPVCKEFREVASFYGYPTISWREMMFPALVRYYLNSNTTFQNNPWPYTWEGTHLSSLGGKLLVDTLIVPFFTAAMAPRAVELPEEERSVYGMGVEVRMFPPTRRPFKILTLSTLYHYYISTSQTLFNAIRKPVEYHLKQRRKENGRWVGNECYGSRDKDAKLLIDFIVPSECNVLDNCRVAVDWVHSWNTTEYGYASCDLLTVNSDSGVKKLETRFVNVTDGGNGHRIKFTGPVSTSFNAVVKEGNYTLSCHKLDSRMTCITSLTVSTSVVL